LLTIPAPHQYHGWDAIRAFLQASLNNLGLCSNSWTRPTWTRPVAGGNKPPPAAPTRRKLFGFTTSSQGPGVEVCHRRPATRDVLPEERVSHTEWLKATLALLRTQYASGCCRKASAL
jgi:hypothetical protein